MNHYTLLCLGDSYTIGESISLHENMPYQLVQTLRKKSLNFTAPEIIAKTGWTTLDLDEAMKGFTFLTKYDFITLLIGVNNQYQGLDVIAYKNQLETILKNAIELANGKKDHVIMLSIPDYSCMPFAASMETDKIAKEIDVYNTVNRALSIQYKTTYIDLTPASRAVKDDNELVAGDSLHPSSKGYALWADMLAAVIIPELK